MGQSKHTPAQRQRYAERAVNEPVSIVAAEAGVSESAIYDWMQQLGLSPSQSQASDASSSSAQAAAQSACAGAASDSVTIESAVEAAATQWADNCWEDWMNWQEDRATGIDEFARAIGHIQGIRSALNETDTDYANLSEGTAAHSFINTKSDSILEESHGLYEMPALPESLINQVAVGDWEIYVWDAAVDNISQRLWTAATGPPDITS